MRLIVFSIIALGFLVFREWMGKEQGEEPLIILPILSFRNKSKHPHPFLSLSPSPLYSSFALSRMKIKVFQMNVQEQGTL